jgi:uncharacterized repeat protein (TIGR01451 family)
LTANFNGTPLTTTYVSATSLTAVIPAADLTATGSNPITVVNAAPGGGTSAAQTFTVNNAQVGPDLAVAITDGLSELQPGAAMPYTLTVTNTGSVDATGVNASATIPTYETFVSSPNGGTVSNGKVVFPPFALSHGGQKLLQFTLALPNPLPTGAVNGTPLVCQASVSDDGTHGTDPNLTNNTATDTDSIVIVMPTIVSAASYTPQSPEVNMPLTFTVGASYPTAAPLTIAWDFGDGNSGSGASALHAYAAAGLYAAVVTVTDGKGGTVTQDVSVPVISQVSSSAAQKKSFVLNFRKGIDGLDISFANPDFKSLQNGQTVSVQIGSHTVDTAVLANGKGTGASGKFIYSSKNQTLEYVSKNASLESVLANYGATNTTMTGSISIPIYISVGNKQYGNSITFSYSAQAGKVGKGF